MIFIDKREGRQRCGYIVIVVAVVILDRYDVFYFIYLFIYRKHWFSVVCIWGNTVGAHKGAGGKGKKPVLQWAVIFIIFKGNVEIMPK